MDIKTLEYMEKRVKKAREIVNEIEQLENNIKNLNDVRLLRFMDYNFSLKFDTSTGDLTQEMKEAYVNITQNRIDYLENKLAEL